MPRNWSKAVPEGNDFVPHQDEYEPDQSMLANVYRLFEERLGRQLNQMKSYFDEFTEKMRETRHHSANLEQDARQPRFATKENVKPDTKARKGMEDVAVERVKSVDNCSAQVATDPMCLTSFGDNFTGPPPLPCTRDDTLVDNSAAAPKSCL